MEEVTKKKGNINQGDHHQGIKKKGTEGEGFNFLGINTTHI